MPASLVHVEVLGDPAEPSLMLEAQIPLHRLEWVLGQPLADRPAERVAAANDLLSAYLLQHVGARSDGLGWTALAPALAVQGEGETAELHVRMRLLPPGGTLPARVTLMYDAVTHSLHTHQVLLHFKRDPDRPLTAAAPLVTGLREDRRSVEIDLQAMRPSALLIDGVRLGAQHLLEGGDHVLFVLLLLLPAPLVQREGRWAPGRNARQTARHVLAVASGFTLGHSLTLAWGVAGGPLPPASAVEVAIALTLLVSAAHAWRPLAAPAAVVTVAGGFGLVHGMAFSQTLLALGLTGGPLWLALLGFNLGIELAQLLVLTLPLPGLLWLARTACYPTVRTTAAVLCAVAALVWLLQRLGLASGDGQQPEAQAAQVLPWLLAAVATVVCAAYGRRKAAAALARQPR